MVVVACAATMSGCGGDGDRLIVAAAASLSEPLSDCAPPFEEADVRLSVGGSDELAAQVRQGANADVYLAADSELAELLYGEGRLERPATFATNELVLAVPADGRSVASLDDLAKPGVRLVMGSESVPVGRYARETLSSLSRRTRDSILRNVRSSEPDARGVTGKLVHGAADAGFVYRSDVDGAGGELRAIRLPERLRPRVLLAGGVVRGTDSPSAARAFVRGLRRGECADALRRHGFGAAP